MDRRFDARGGRPIRSYRDFDAFHGIHDQQTQVTIKGVALPDRIERGVGPKGAITWIAEGMPIAAEPVVVHYGQPVHHRGSVALHSTRQEQVGLLLRVSAGLSYFTADLRAKKHPPKCACLAAEARRVC